MTAGSGRRQVVCRPADHPVEEESASAPSNDAAGKYDRSTAEIATLRAAERFVFGCLENSEQSAIQG